MKIKLLKPYSMFPKDAVVDFGRGIAEVLISRKVAVEVPEKKKAATGRRVTLGDTEDVSK